MTPTIILKNRTRHSASIQIICLSAKESVKMTFRFCNLARYFSAFLLMFSVHVMFEINKKLYNVQFTCIDAHVVAIAKRKITAAMVRFSTLCSTDPQHLDRKNDCRFASGIKGKSDSCQSLSDFLCTIGSRPYSNKKNYEAVVHG